MCWDNFLVVLFDAKFNPDQIMILTSFLKRNVEPK